MISSSYRQSSKTLFAILFQCADCHHEGTILIAVLPYCIINCLILYIVDTVVESSSSNNNVGSSLSEIINGFSPTGHGLLTLLISYLVISKVNLAYDRYMKARHSVGSAFITLRQLHQLCIMISFDIEQKYKYKIRNTHSRRNNNNKKKKLIVHDLQQQQQQSSSTQQQQQQQAVPQQLVIQPDVVVDQNDDDDEDDDPVCKIIQEWRSICYIKIVELIDATRQVIQDEELAIYLARNVRSSSNQSSNHCYHDQGGTTDCWSRDQNPNSSSNKCRNGNTSIVGGILQRMNPRRRRRRRVGGGGDDDDDDDDGSTSIHAIYVDNEVEAATKATTTNRTSNTNTTTRSSSSNHNFVVDPLLLCQSLRMHLYTGYCCNDVELVDLPLLSRVKLVDRLDEYVSDYKQLLHLSSTPLPISLVSMGRTFLFVWTFSMPFVLRQGNGPVFNSLWTAMIFLFFLTYGFIGLELVSIKLVNPFGDTVHDIQVSNIRDATINGIENDLLNMNLPIINYSTTTSNPTISQRRYSFSQQKQQQPQQQRKRQQQQQQQQQHHYRHSRSIHNNHHHHHNDQQQQHTDDSGGAGAGAGGGVVAAAGKYSHIIVTATAAAAAGRGIGNDNSDEEGNTTDQAMAAAAGGDGGD